MDPGLKPYRLELERRHRRAVLKELELADGQPHLSDVCNNHLYYGLHATSTGWVSPGTRRRVGTTGVPARSTTG